MLITALLTTYFSLFAIAGGVGANTGLFGPFPSDNPGRTLLGIGMGLWLSVTWPFYLVGF